jgi:hypothetical protein
MERRTLSTIPAMRHPEGHDERHLLELSREALTMMLYVAIVLLAGLVALPADDLGFDLAALVWGTAIGLAVAHWFAFRVAARLFGDGRLGPRDVQLALVQVLAAALVAIVASAPLLFVSDDTGAEVAAIELSALIGLAGYQTARRAGAGHGRALAAGVGTLLVGGLVVTVKVLVSH